MRVRWTHVPSNGRGLGDLRELWGRSVGRRRGGANVSAGLNFPYDLRGFPDEDEELRIVKQACLDAFGPCGEEVPIELLASLRRLRVGVVGRTHLLRMGNAAARAYAD